MGKTTLMFWLSVDDFSRFGVPFRRCVHPSPEGNEISIWRSPSEDTDTCFGGYSHHARMGSFQATPKEARRTDAPGCQDP